MIKDIKLFLLIYFAFLSGINSHAQNVVISEINFPTELQLNNGKTIKLNDLKGKVLLLDFWYRGCFPCLKATPDLIKMQEEFKEHLVIIGVNDIDEKQDITDYYAYKKGNYFSTFKNDKDISKSLKINIFPTIIILNQKGEVVEVNQGFDKKEIRKTIKRLIKESK